MKIARITTVQAGLEAGASIAAELKGRWAVLGLMAVLFLAGGAEALEINATFVDGIVEIWDSTRKGVINQAIADWELSILDNQSVDVDFEFSYAGTSSYLGHWSGAWSVSAGTDIYPWTSGVSHTICFNADLFGGTYYLWWDPTPGTSDDQPFYAYDALSVARHEIAHMMGFTDGFYKDDVGTGDQVDRWLYQIDGTTFNPGGLNVSMHSEDNLSHVADSGATEGDLMVTALVNSIRRHISQTDREMLALAHGYTVIAGVPGDVDGNGWGSEDDLTTIINNWGLSGATRLQGDLNDNGVVDGPDYTEVLSYWNPPSEPPSEAVPEPATLGLMLVGGLVLIRRRREG